MGPRNTQRWSPAWRPFEGALSVHSQRDTDHRAQPVRMARAPALPGLQLLGRCTGAPRCTHDAAAAALSQKQWDLVQG